MIAHSCYSRPAAVTIIARPCVQTTRCSIISASYKNKENIDLQHVTKFARNEKDTGSPQYQIALATARVEQISKHLENNRKDHAAKRGLLAVLSLRKRMLQYLYRKDRNSYDHMLATFKLRGVVASDTRGATRIKTESVAEQAKGESGSTTSKVTKM